MEYLVPQQYEKRLMENSLQISEKLCALGCFHCENFFSSLLFSFSLFYIALRANKCGVLSLSSITVTQLSWPCLNKSSQTLYVHSKQTLFCIFSFCPAAHSASIEAANTRSPQTGRPLVSAWRQRSVSIQTAGSCSLPPCGHFWKLKDHFSMTIDRDGE